MPGFNQQGPDGSGAMTGRQRGMCRRTENQFIGGDAGSGFGRGRGMGMRRGPGSGLRQGLNQGQSVGQGRRGVNIVSPSQRGANERVDEVKSLQEEYQAAQKVLKTIEEKIAALKSGM